MKLLCIGNSFSQDACAYMDKIAAVGNFDLTTVNLFIGGCSLERHATNIGVFDKDHRYTKYVNSVSMGYISLEEALTEDTYDIVSVQQASPHSGVWETYQPYIEEVVDYVRKHQPGAKIAIHETWAYEADLRLNFLKEKYEGSRHVMHERLSECYRRAEKLIGADLFIPSGDVIKALRDIPAFDPEMYGARLTSDGGHLSKSYGRYAAGLTWCAALGMENIMENTFVPPFVDIRRDLINIIKETVVKTVISGDEK